MSADGAQEGILPEAAMRSIIGGEPVPEPPASLTDIINTVMTTPLGEHSSYNSTSCAMARALVEMITANPELGKGPVENEYARDDNGEKDFTTVERPGWYEIALEYYADRPDVLEPFNAASGFMWGWAANMARTILEMPAVPNPAIITIGGEA